MLASHIDPYATGVLKPEIHGRLVADIEQFARDAAITPDRIWTPVKGRISLVEHDYLKALRRLPQEGITGLCFEGTDSEFDPVEQMSLLAGVILRNFVRARVMTLNAVIEHITENRAAPEHTVLLIPNFYAPGSGGEIEGAYAKRRISLLVDALIERHTEGKQTVVAVSSMDGLRKDYGAMIQQHVKRHFKTVSVG